MTKRKNSISELILSKNFHAVNFTYQGVEYSFSGWWLLDWGDDDKTYSSREEFMSDRIFGGKTISEVESDITDVDFEFEA